MTTHEWPYRMTGAEKQSGLDRVRLAELLISQLPDNHDGRNTWLLNYGIKPEAQQLREKRNIEFIESTRSAKTTGTP